MTDKKIYAKDDYLALSRDEMYGALRDIDPTRAKGKSRAKKDELVQLYGAALMDYAQKSHVHFQTEEDRARGSDFEDTAELVQDPTPVIGMDEILAKGDSQLVVVGDGSHGKALREAAFVGGHSVLMVPENHEHHAHVHGPNCDHTHDELPTLAGTDEFERVNPEMPGILSDGAAFRLPEESERLFTFKDGVDRDPTEKEKVIIERLTKNFDAFCANPANNEAKRAVQSDIYSLKTSGIIANPKFAETLKKGRSEVRDFRRQMKMGAVGNEVKQATVAVKRDQAAEKLDEAVKAEQQAGV